MIKPHAIQPPVLELQPAEPGHASDQKIPTAGLLCRSRGSKTTRPENDWKQP